MNISITPEGIVSNDGNQIGTITDGVCALTVKGSGPLKGAINKANGSQLRFSVADESSEEDEPDAPTNPPPVADDPEPPQNPRLGTLTPGWAEWKARQNK